MPSENSIRDEDQQCSREQPTNAEGDRVKIHCLRARYQHRGDGCYWERQAMKPNRHHAEPYYLAQPPRHREKNRRTERCPDADNEHYWCLHSVRHCRVSGRIEQQNPKRSAHCARDERYKHLCQLPSAPPPGYEHEGSGAENEHDHHDEHESKHDDRVVRRDVAPDAANGGQSHNEEAAHDAVEEFAPVHHRTSHLAASFVGRPWACRPPRSPETIYDFFSAFRHSLINALRSSPLSDLARRGRWP